MTEHTPVDPSERVPAPHLDFEPAKLRPRYDGWTAEKQVAFIEALAETKCVDEACRRVGMSDTSAYELRRRACGAAFAEAWDMALKYLIPAIEQGAMQRSLHGVPRPIFYKGEQVGEWRHYDERLTMFMLRRRRPERYGQWIDRFPPPRPHPMDEGNAPYRLDDCLLDIRITAPAEHGNRVDDWDEDDDDGDEAAE